MKKNKLVRRAELRKLRQRLAIAEQYDMAWCKHEIEMLGMRVAAIERWVDLFQRAAVANPEAVHEVALAALAAKREPDPW